MTVEGCFCYFLLALQGRFGDTVSLLSKFPTFWLCWTCGSSHTPRSPHTHTPIRIFQAKFCLECSFVFPIFIFQAFLVIHQEYLSNKHTINMFKVNFASRAEVILSLLPLQSRRPARKQVLGVRPEKKKKDMSGNRSHPDKSWNNPTLFFFSLWAGPISGRTSGPSRSTQLISQECPGVTEVKFITDKTTRCNFPGQISRNDLV